jgi:hypothetical protein
LSFSDRFSILTVTNVIHDPFQNVDRLGLAISQFGPGFLGERILFRVVAGKWAGSALLRAGQWDAADGKGYTHDFLGETCRSQKIN